MKSSKNDFLDLSEMRKKCVSLAVELSSLKLKSEAVIGRYCLENLRLKKELEMLRENTGLLRKSQKVQALVDHVTSSLRQQLSRLQRDYAYLQEHNSHLQQANGALNYHNKNMNFIIMQMRQDQLPTSPNLCLAGYVRVPVPVNSGPQLLEQTTANRQDQHLAMQNGSTQGDAYDASTGSLSSDSVDCNTPSSELLLGINSKTGSGFNQPDGSALDTSLSLTQQTTDYKKTNDILYQVKASELQKTGKKLTDLQQKVKSQLQHIIRLQAEVISLNDKLESFHLERNSEAYVPVSISSIWSKANDPASNANGTVLDSETYTI